MPKKKKNHFVSRGIVQFWTDENGQVSYWEKNLSDSFEKRNPTSVHQSEYLYAKWNSQGSRDMSAENFLATEVDDKAPQEVRTIISRFPHILPLSESQKYFWARYTLRTIIRNPAMIDHLLRTRQALFLRWTFRVLRWLERGRRSDTAYATKGLSRTLQGDIISGFVTSNIDHLVKYFSQMRYVFMIPEGDAPNFILGSQPYFIKPDMRDMSGDRSPKKDAFCGVVIHPRILLALFDDAEEDAIAPANLEDIRRINGMFAKYSSAIVAANPRDLDEAWFLPFGKEESDERAVFKLR